MKLRNMESNIQKYNIETKIEPIAAYFSLILSMLKEPFVSSDAKYLMIQSGEVGDFADKVSAFVKENIEINSFMG